MKNKQILTLFFSRIYIHIKFLSFKGPLIIKTSNISTNIFLMVSHNHVDKQGWFWKKKKNYLSSQATSRNSSAKTKTPPSSQTVPHRRQRRRVTGGGEKTPELSRFFPGRNGSLGEGPGLRRRGGEAVAGALRGGGQALVGAGLGDGEEVQGDLLRDRLQVAGDRRRGHQAGRPPRRPDQAPRLRPPRALDPAHPRDPAYRRRRLVGARRGRA